MSRQLFTKLKLFTPFFIIKRLLLLYALALSGIVSAQTTLPQIVNVSSASSCLINTAIITVNGTLNDATEWVLYSNACGGTQIATSTTGIFNVSVSATTTYYVRGEGGGVVYGSNSLIWEEQFNGGIPSTWTLNSFPAGADWAWSSDGKADDVTIGGSTYVASFWGSGGPIQSPSVANGVAMFNADAYEFNGGFLAGLGPFPAPFNSSMTSPSIDCSGLGTVSLKFNQYFRYCCSSNPPSILEVSNDNGATWTNFPINLSLAINASTPADDVIDLDISSVAANQSNVKVRFSWGDNDIAYYWLIDDVQIISTGTGGGGATGCTSVVVDPSIFTNETNNIAATTCDPAEVGVTTQTLTNQFGCDSTVITTTTFDSPLAPPTVSGITACEGDDTEIVPVGTTPLTQPYEAVWNFEGETVVGSSNQTNIVADDAVAGAGVGSVSFPAGNGSTDAFSGNSWTSGTDEYFEFCINATNGTLDVTGLAFGIKRSGTGPADIIVEHAINGSSTYSTTTNINLSSDAWFNITETITAVTGVNSICFRIRATTNASSAAGTLRVDDFTITGEVMESSAVSYNFYDTDPGAGPANLLAGPVASYDPGTTAATSPQTVWVTSTDGTCESSAVSVTVTVDGGATVTFPDPDPICLDDGSQTLGGATPTGGMYSGTGVTDDGNGMTFSFDPTVSGAGMTDVTYDYTPPAGWNQVGADINGQATGDGFGANVDFSQDGTRFIAGANGADPGGFISAGQASVFEWDGSAWVQMGPTFDGSRNSEFFGHGVAITPDGNRVAIGSVFSFPRRVDIYDWNGTTWVQVGVSIPTGGNSLDFSANGNRIAIGNSFSDRVYVYDWNGSAWVQEGNTLMGDRSGDRFGEDVKISGDGSILAVGAGENNFFLPSPKTGYAKVYQLVGSTWTQMGQKLAGTADNDYYGQSLDLANSGMRIAISNTGQGNAQVFDYDGTNWVQAGADVPGGFPGYVSLDDSGNRLASVVATFATRVGIFDWNGSSWINTGAEISPFSAPRPELSGDGMRVLTGNSQSNNFVQVYEAASSCPGSATAKVTVLPSTDAGDDKAISLCEDEIVDLSTLVTVSGGSFSIAGSPISSTYAPVGLSGQVVTITYTVASTTECPDGTATITVTVTPACTAPPTLSACSQVSAGVDDSEEKPNGKIKRGSSDLDLVEEGKIQMVGMRFNNLNIPQGATITSAYIQFTTEDDENTDPCDLTIRGQASDDALSFGTDKFDISSRPKTTANTLWSPAPWTTIGEAGMDQKTPDLSSVIQEIVGRSGYTSASSIVIIIDGVGERDAESFNGNPALAPILCVEYTVVPESCPAPMGLTGTTNDNDATVNWNLSGSATDYNLRFRETGSAIWISGFNNLTPPIAFSSLTACTEYEFQVQANCTGETSTWSPSTVLMTTGCVSTCSDGIQNGSETGVDCGGPDCGPCTVTETTVCVQIDKNSDDGEEEINDGTVSIGSSDLEMAKDGDEDQIVGMRFKNLNIPQGATITEAYIQFTAEDHENENPCSLNIYGEANDDAPTFSNAAYNISLRPTTSASVNWAPLQWTSKGDAGMAQKTPDLSSVVQEIVSRSGFTTNSAIVIMVDGTGKRVAESYNGSSSKAPKLCVKYTSASGLRTALTGLQEVTKEMLENSAVQLSLLEVYPNPGTDKFTLTFESNGQGPLRLQMVNMHGQVIVKEMYEAEQGENTIQLNDLTLASGVYHIRLITGKSTQFVKVVVQH